MKVTRNFYVEKLSNNQYVIKQEYIKINYIWLKEEQVSGYLSYYFDKKLCDNPNVERYDGWNSLSNGSFSHLSVYEISCVQKFDTEQEAKDKIFEWIESAKDKKSVFDFPTILDSALVFTYTKEI